MFRVLKKDNITNARLGVLNTPHGKVETPAYVIVATHAQIKCLRPSDIKKTKTQIIIANTYHLWDRALEIQNSKLKIRGILGTKIPTMTDSGGFQVFSLGFGPEAEIRNASSKDKSGFRYGVNKILSGEVRKFKNIKRTIKITDKGVYFKWNGTTRFLGPEPSIQIQEKLGADIIFAFDECTSPLDGFAYNKKALERTSKWAKRCLAAKTRNDQLLFGIVQGGRFRSLREKSAKHIASLPFDGIGIGGSFGKDEMLNTIKWIIPHLPEEKPRHLLGIGKIEDVFNAVEQGVDMFDCVIPTREARHGRIYTKQGHFDIHKHKNDKTPLEKGCKCPTCSKKITRVKLSSLFKSSQPVRQAQGKRYATIHNIWFFNDLLENIRKSILKDEFSKFKKKFLADFRRS